MDLYQAFIKSKIILEGHFKLNSGRHSGLYVNKDAIYSNPFLLETIVSLIAEKVPTNIGPIILTGPAIAGALIALPVSMKLKKQFVYPEKVYEIDQETNSIISNKMEFRRGYNKIIKDKSLIIIEDVITTGGSILRTIDAANRCGSSVAGVISIWNRSGWILPNSFNETLINKPVPSFDKENCYLCNENLIPLSDPKGI